MKRDGTEVSRTMNTSYIVVVTVYKFNKMHQIVHFKIHAFYWQY